MEKRAMRWFVPGVVFALLLGQSAISLAGKSTTLTKAQIVDGMAVDESLILSSGDGFGTESANAYSVDAKLSLGVNGDGCNNSTSTISFDGTLEAKNVKTKILIQTSSVALKGQTDDIWQGAAELKLDLNLAEDPLPIEKQPVVGGVGGNPFIYVRFKQANGQYKSENSGWVLAGRCVQGSRNVADVLLNLPGRRFLRIASSQCSTGNSSFGLSHRGGPRLRGEVAFTNQRVSDPSYAIHHSDGTNFNGAILSLKLGTGSIPYSSAYRWAGGNPAFGARFETSTPDVYTKPIMLGRCKALAGTLPDTIDTSY